MIKISIDKASSQPSNDILAQSNKALEDYLKATKKNAKSKRRDFDVTELNLANKGIAELKSLVRFKNLARLWLQSNKIRQLPFIQNCDSLSEIYLQNNLIQTIEYCFRGLTNISVLYLNMNQLFDLKSVANELSYLKYLKILNLFENPIALETEYNNLIIYRCKSIEIFDKHLLSRNERDRINKMYEPDLLRIERQRAFLRTFNLDTFNDTDNLSQKLLGKRSSLATTNSKSVVSIRPSLLSRKFYTDPNRQSSLSRSIKEFSYFDWSKVKLYKEDYLSNYNITANNNTTSDSRTSLSVSNNSNYFTNNNTISLAALSNKSNETNSQNISKNELQPQVITIRYT